MTPEAVSRVEAGSRPAGAGLLRLYPPAWRRRYESEMVAMLEQMRLGPRGRLDLVRGAIDAQLHGSTRVTALAALVAGGLWTFAGAGILAQPTPPDWPGYLIETIPMAIAATILGAVAIVGCWARRSDDAGRAGSVAIALAVAGHVGWLVALAAAWLGIGYGAATIAAQSLGVIGATLVGLTLLRTNDAAIGAVLVIAPALMLFGWPAAWLGFGLGWTLVGFLLLRPEPDATPTRLA